MRTGGGTPDFFGTWPSADVSHAQPIGPAGSFFLRLLAGRVLAIGYRGHPQLERSGAPKNLYTNEIRELTFLGRH
jgi:hypothetical protein